MIAIYFLGLVAFTSAAPQYFHHHRHSPSFHHHEDFGMSDEYFKDDIFDTRKFWQELSTELAKLDEVLTDFSKHFPSTSSNEGIEGNEYKITITLNGFEEKDIVVKAREGVLMIQAVHDASEGTGMNYYLDLRTLPSYVNAAGSWTYNNGVLKIVFPLNSKPEEVTTEAVVTESPKEQSREEMETDRHDGTQDVDVGLSSSDKDNELLTNEIPTRNTVEATTYAVDLKDEVEFVPVRY